ncbi:aminopeptidase I zinc metalloprotease (M18) [Roseburia inulinivorans DSM 16841]|jgi:aspartyl aminopeptidase|uniref:M18 family aminopeptidase n=1 Tax=Roseburia inulinivorans DSM 16841 TaxID=622312 RepID=C0FXI9_9FIRM|nr:aminopeptidase [Roseburia inulinivorans]EEG92683.1 aminopeptidase I zinc metalloprotease (M18) [Roseburia inulinivorans DSM 16841]MCC3342095.1 aminopeptidase [Roseburia inulinivorans DSM 16841]
MENKIAWEKYPEGNKREEVFQFAENYRKFISDCKTERECVSFFVEKAEKAGFVNLEKVIAEHTALKAGDRVYANNMGKGMALFVIGKESMEKGMNILGAHIDSPRLDLKQDPLYEDTDFAMLDTHYYGGIKKYQWVTLPLALHGVIAKKDGTVVEVNIGDKPGDPVFGVSDLLIHLSGEQLEKKAAKVIEGENLDLLIGSIPMQTEDEKVKEKVKANIMNLLSKEYGIEEEDFLSAEIEVVPAGEAKDYGFDRSMIMGYGHDDRVCAYPSFEAMLVSEDPEITSVCLLVDKEEIGSVGASGMQSRFFENTVAEVMAAAGSYSELALRRALAGSKVLSSDVSAAFDPNFPSVMTKRNTAYFGKGLVFNKYTGSRGKGGSNDANAEYIGKLRNIMDTNEVSFQTAELGKVDQGGGGTIAYILANYGMNVIDSGVPVLNMHAPWEIISKVDLYEAYRGYIAFLKEA